MKRKSLRERVLCLIIGLLFATTLADAQNNRVNGVVKVLNNFGNPVCFFIDAVCNMYNDCCGERCVIDGEIYLADCGNGTPINPNHHVTYHVDYINGGWQWGHVCRGDTECVICGCSATADQFAHNAGLTNSQDLAELAQYLYTCCAPMVPNPIECDSITYTGPSVCTKFTRWCCNGKLVRLECTLYNCENEEEIIFTDAFSLNYNGSGGVNEKDSYDIYADPDNPCALSEAQRRILLHIFLSISSDPCDNTRTKSINKKE